MALLTKGQILKAEDRRFSTVNVPAWGGEVRVGSMSALQWDHWEEECVRAREEGGAFSKSVRALLVSYCAVDDKGAPLFTPEDVEALGLKDRVAVNLVFAAAVDLNKISREKAEELRGN